MAQRAGQGARHGRTGQDAAPPRLRGNGQPAAAYTWHVAPGGVLVVVDLDRGGWRSVTNQGLRMKSHSGFARSSVAT